MMTATRLARPASGAGAGNSWQARSILLTMCLGILIAQIDTSVVNLALAPIGTASMPRHVLQWVIDAYNLVYASLLLTAGTLADLYGRRRIFALGVALFTVGSLVCGFAPDEVVLVAGRALSGLGAALLVPTSLAILAVTYEDAAERARALGIWASCYGRRARDRPEPRRLPGRAGRLAQHLPDDRAVCLGRARPDLARAAEIARSGRTATRSPGPVARHRDAGAADACRDRGSALERPP